MSEVKIEPCRKCGQMPVKIRMNTGLVIINPNSDKPYTNDRWSEFYACPNLSCPIPIDDSAAKKRNKQQKADKFYGDLANECEADERF